MNLTGQFVVTDQHQGAPGLAHGGLLALAFDEALGKLMWLLRAPAVTARLETDFMKPVPIGSTLFITAEIVGQEGRKVYSKAEGRLDSQMDHWHFAAVLSMSLLPWIISSTTRQMDTSSIYRSIANW